jgi:hypothetical protein
MEIGFNSSQLNLTWNLISYQNDRMNINLTFNNPLEISPNIEQDQLTIFFDSSCELIKCLNSNQSINLGNDS